MIHYEQNARLPSSGAVLHVHVYLGGDVCRTSFSHSPIFVLLEGFLFPLGKKLAFVYTFDEACHL